MINHEVQKSIKDSVLCWLATVDKDGQPSVSPKEMFMASAKDTLLIANIASPKSVRNIASNQKVCVSFVDILKQRGYKLYGTAANLSKSESSFASKCEQLYSNLGGRDFPIHSIFEISVTGVEAIVAPSYSLIPEVSESQIIEQSLKTYGVTIQET